MTRTLVAAACCFTLLCLLAPGCGGNSETEVKETLVGENSGPPEDKENSENDPARGGNGGRRGSYFRQHDTDDDGKWSRDETPDWASFDQIDADKDGFATDAEFVAFVSQFGGGGGQTSTPDDGAIVAMLERVGGTFERANRGYGPNRIATISLVDTTATAKDVEQLKNLAELFELQLASKGLNDDCLDRLKEFPLLTFIRLGGKQFTDDGMQHLISLAELRKIELKETAIGSKGLLTLSKVPNLEFCTWSSRRSGPSGWKRCENSATCTKSASPIARSRRTNWQSCVKRCRIAT